MIVPISILAYKRPQYLVRALESIKISIAYAKKLDSSLDFVLVPSVEPGCDEVRNIIEKIDFVDCKPYYNSTRLGMNRNAYLSFERALDYGNVLIQTEEDGTISEDCIWYAISMLNKYENDDDVMYISYHHNNLNDPQTDKVFKHFGGFIGACIFWKKKYDWFRNNWIPQSHGQSICYDTWFDRRFPKNKAVVLPVVCRARHIGENDGTYATPEMVRSAYINLYAGDFEPVYSWKEI